jgi:hypothetical protein
MAETERYQGWKNYETWAVALWLDNEEESYDESHALARAAWDDAEPDETFSRAEVARLALASSIKEWIERDNPLEGKNTLYSDLLNAALSEVDWHEIADHYLDDIAEDAAESEADDTP